MAGENGGKLAVFLLALGFLVSVELLVLVCRDIIKIIDARNAAEAGAAARLDDDGGGTGSSSGSSLPALPKVALLFLTRGDMPAEPLWRLFLDSASAAHVPSPGQPALRRLGKAPASAGGSGSGGGWQRLFTVYVHPPPGYQYKQGSLFKTHEVAGRVAVQWGQHSTVDAELALLRAALAEPANQRFVLLSDSCIPLYAAPLVYAQLMSEPRSRVNACTNVSDPQDFNQRMAYRWQQAMAGYNITQDSWRKSTQWFMLTRGHVELVVSDSSVDAAFRQECWTAEDNSRFCASDEHYIPTLLAVKGLEEEAECRGVITYARWEGPYLHPKTFARGEASVKVLAEMRSGCNGSVIASASPAAVGALLRKVRGSETSSEASGGGLGPADVLAALAAAKQHLLAPSCPLFGRKVATDAMQQWLPVLKHVMQV